MTENVEEARRVDVVCFGRRGQVLAQDSPDRLLRKFKCGTLEEVHQKIHGEERSALIRLSESLLVVGENRTARAVEPWRKVCLDIVARTELVAVILLPNLIAVLF